MKEEIQQEVNVGDSSLSAIYAGDAKGLGMVSVQDLSNIKRASIHVRGWVSASDGKWCREQNQAVGQGCEGVDWIQDFGAYVEMGPWHHETSRD